MRRMSMGACAIVAAGALATAASAEGNIDSGIPGVRVASAVSIDPSNVNAGVEASLLAGEVWAADPLEVVRRHLVVLDAREVWIHRRDGAGERPGETVITVVRDGFLDDSVAGDWHRYELARGDDGVWRATSLLSAGRCWRGEDPAVFVADPCP